MLRCPATLFPNGIKPHFPLTVRCTQCRWLESWLPWLWPSLTRSSSWTMNVRYLWMLFIDLCLSTTGKTSMGRHSSYLLYHIHFNIIVFFSHFSYPILAHTTFCTGVTNVVKIDLVLSLADLQWPRAHLLKALYWDASPEIKSRPA